MSEMPDSAMQLLAALVEIEERAKLEAQLNGCRCRTRDPVSGRDLPVALFSREKNDGKPASEFEWEMKHEVGCPAFGQKGVG